MAHCADGVCSSRLVDADGDGDSAFVCGGADCDDADPLRAPGMPEHCDGVDEDCDGSVDEDAVDASTFFADGDGDGFGDGAALVACAQPAGTSVAAGDCWPADATRHPAADEVCLDGTAAQGLDDDCDGTVDEGCPRVHCGTIAADETWSAAESHFISCDLIVEGPAAPLLTIEAGAHVSISGAANIRVQGAGEVLLDGTAAPILLEWDRLGANKRIDIQVGPRTVLRGVTVRGGGVVLRSSAVSFAVEDLRTEDSYYPLYSICDGCTATFRRLSIVGSNDDCVSTESNLVLEASTIDGCDGTGIWAQGPIGGSTEIAIRDSTIQNATGDGVHVGTDTRLVSFERSTTTANGYAGLHVREIQSALDLDPASIFAGNATGVEVTSAVGCANGTLTAIDAEYFITAQIHGGPPVCAGPSSIIAIGTSLVLESLVAGWSGPVTLEVQASTIRQRQVRSPCATLGPEVSGSLSGSDISGCGRAPAPRLPGVPALAVESTAIAISGNQIHDNPHVGIECAGGCASYPNVSGNTFANNAGGDTN